MIDPSRERCLTLNHAAQLKWIPGRRAGKRIHISTLHRWAQRGCRGVLLETIRIGGTLCTSEEALMRFFERLSCPSDQLPTTTSTREHEHAEARLEAAGL